MPRKKLNKTELEQKYVFKVGDWAKVSGIVNFFSGVGPDSKEMVRTFEVQPLEEPRFAQIVGAKHKYLGTLVPSRGYYDEYEQGYLNVEKSIFVWEIKFGLLNKIEYALPEDLWIHLTPPSKLPLFYNPQPLWTEHHKVAYREMVKDLERDAKGRWI